MARCTQRCHKCYKLGTFAHDCRNSGKNPTMLLNTQKGNGGNSQRGMVVLSVGDQGQLPKEIVFLQLDGDGWNFKSVLIPGAAPVRVEEKFVRKFFQNCEFWHSEGYYFRNDEGFNHEAYWSRIEQPRTEKKKLADIRASGIKESSEIYGGHFVTKIARKLGFYNQRELAKCSKPIKSESWDDRMFGKAFNRRAKKNGYMLEHSMPYLHHLADEANFAYPPYESPNVPPYSYPYMPYTHRYMHYSDIGNLSYREGQYGALGNDYLFTGAMPSHGDTSIVPISGYDVRGSSRGAQDDDDDDDMSDDN
ncbi:hypothetical protein Tco_0315948 [Tanacetum coccineum]